MPDYKTMYFRLAARVADAVELLIASQQQGEDAYVESTDRLFLTLATDVSGNEDE